MADPENRRWQRYVPVAAGTVIVLLVVVAMLHFVRSMLNSKPTGPTRAVEQKITMIRPPPPPPDTPPPPPPPPEEKLETPVEQAQPEQAPSQADAAPTEQLGLDADGSGAGDGFGLAARKGGRDIVGTGTAPFKWYTSLLQTKFQDCLSADERTRKGSYRVNVRIRVGTDGRFEVDDLLNSTGNSERDQAIRNLKRCSTGEGRPMEMPQLVTLQVVSRG